jgi:hypothetical protein
MRSDRLYHTERSASAELGRPYETGDMSLLRKAIRRGGFEDDELRGVSPDGLEEMREAVLELLRQIKDMTERLPRRKVETAIMERLLFVRGVLAIPLMPFKDPEDDLWNTPNSVFKSTGVELQLESMLVAIRNQKTRNRETQIEWS